MSNKTSLSISLLVAAAFCSPAWGAPPPPPPSPVAANPAVSNLQPSVQVSSAKTGIPSSLQSAQEAIMHGKKAEIPVGGAPGRAPQSASAMTRQQKQLAKEAAEVWSSTPAQPRPAPYATPGEAFSHAHHESAKKRREERIAKFRATYQGRLINVPVANFYTTLESNARIKRILLPPDAHLAILNGKPAAMALPHLGGKVWVLRFDSNAAWHPVQIMLQFAGGIRTIYVLPKPGVVARTIHVRAPKYVPKVALHQNASGNPNSSFLPAIRAVWEHKNVIPGFTPSSAPRKGLNYGRLKLMPVEGWEGNSGTNWMILWHVVPVRGEVSNISPAQFTGPGIHAVSLTGTQVGPESEPYLLTVEGVAHVR